MKLHYKKSDEIEALVRQRRTVLALQAIAKYFRKNKSIPGVMEECLLWYRRLGATDHAFRLLKFPNFFDRTQSLSPSDLSLRKIWTAHFIDRLGARTYAKKLIEGATAETGIQWRILGEIALGNGDGLTARTCFQKSLEGPNPVSPASHFIIQVMIADALLLEQGAQVALQYLDCHPPTSDSPALHQGIFLSARGEYLCALEHYSEAIEVLNQASQAIPGGDQSVDRGVLEKWLGYAKGRMNLENEAQEHFRRSLEILEANGSRLEARIKTFELMARLGYLNSSELQSLAAHGMVGTQLQSFNTSPSNAGQAPDLIIDFQRGEVSSPAGITLGISTENALLGYVLLSGFLGLQVERAMELLWPADWKSFPFLRSRIHQLIRRIRKIHGIELTIQNSTIHIKSLPIRSIRVVPSDGKTPIPSFLTHHKLFSRDQLQSYYRIARSQAFKILSDWQASGMIARQSDAARVGLYLFCATTQSSSFTINDFNPESQLAPTHIADAT